MTTLVGLGSLCCSYISEESFQAAGIPTQPWLAKSRLDGTTSRWLTIRDRHLKVPPGLPDISLFGSQCLHRIEARRTPRGNDACERGHCEQRCGNGGVNRRIELLDLVEQIAHQLAGFQACCQSHDKAEDRGPRSIQQHLPHHVFALCAERDADADF